MSVTRTAIMDVLAIVVFAILARLAHNTAEAPFTLVNVLNTLWPFLLGGALGHVICAATRKDPFPIAPGGVIVWLSTAITGLAIWGIRHAELPHWSFIIVATTMSAILLLGFRALAKAVVKR